MRYLVEIEEIGSPVLFSCAVCGREMGCGAFWILIHEIKPESEVLEATYVLSSAEGFVACQCGAKGDFPQLFLEREEAEEYRKRWLINDDLFELEGRLMDYPSQVPSRHD